MCIRDRANTPIEQLDRAKAVVEKELRESIPTAEWKRNEKIITQGHPWYCIEFAASRANASIHKIVLFTFLRGKYVQLAFWSTRDEFPKVEEVLWRSIKSITVQPN